MARAKLVKKRTTLDSQMYLAVADVLLLGLELPRARTTASVAELQQRLVGALDTMVGKGRKLGIADKELAEARYALTAFLDEQVLKSSWTGAAEWMNHPLQLRLYRESAAGENFFVRLRALVQNGGSVRAIEAYYLCLALGFRGAYGQSGDTRSLASYSSSARQFLVGDAGPAPRISPNVLPPDRATQLRESNWFTFVVPAAGLMLLVLAVGALHLSIGHKLQDALRRIEPPIVGAINQ